MFQGDNGGSEEEGESPWQLRPAASPRVLTPERVRQLGLPEDVNLRNTDV